MTSGLASAMTKAIRVSSSATVATVEGKNWGVSDCTTKPWSLPATMGEAGLSEMPMTVTP